MSGGITRTLQLLKTKRRGFILSEAGARFFFHHLLLFYHFEDLFFIQRLAEIFIIAL